MKKPKGRPTKDEYRAYLLSDKWQSKARKVRERADFKCEKCGQNTNGLDVHHQTYDHVFHERLDELMCLCRECHELTHKELKPKYGRNAAYLIERAITEYGLTRDEAEKRILGV